MKVVTTENKPIKMWLDDLEDKALEQAKNLANLPFVFRHIALMPDCHVGYGMPIGGVLATKEVIIPNAVGVDIGCGMVAVRTNIIDISQGDLKKVMKLVRKSVPVGFKHHKEEQDARWMPTTTDRPEEREGTVVYNEWQSARKQIGTLGGGNHFVEIQRGDGNIWIMIHSGSRYLGKQVADHYNKQAVSLNKKWYSSVPPAAQLAFLPVDMEEAQYYLMEMQFCLEFAFNSRKLMMERVQEAVVDVVPDATFDEMINIHHNYVALENHFGKNVWVHRKGATRAREGEQGIIPGSQGTNSYIVRGKGNKESFTSCSHGAGRKMGRKAAQRNLDLKQQVRMLDDKGVLHSVRGKRDLDEAPGAYKHIRDVMKNQQDLVDIEVKLRPLAVIKG